MTAHIFPLRVRMGGVATSLQVAPSMPTHHHAQLIPNTYISVLETLFGFIYLVGSVVCSFVYLGILSPYVANDMWWPSFNATGAHTFVADLVNDKMSLNRLGPVDLFGVGAVVEKSYA
ncbi:hypothetical protein AaE_000700, partial [Aphanomyces astaci]